MGIWSWFFPSADDRVATAKKRMEAGRWADARLEVLELDHPEAAGIVSACEAELAKMNLEAAISWCRAGDDPRTSHHLEVAETFRQPGLEDAFREARREMRAIRQERTVAEQRKKEEEQARLMSADPLGLTGGPSWRDPTLPADFLDAHDDEAAARLAL
ncbi:MAG: hypothetical protein KC656_21305, partial [Myxococcales bacterium]|nr:hypothetical protein [Myxococcales bacterium]